MSRLPIFMLRVAQTVTMLQVSILYESKLNEKFFFGHAESLPSPSLNVSYLVVESKWTHSSLLICLLFPTHETTGTPYYAPLVSH